MCPVGTGRDRCASFSFSRGLADGHTGVTGGGGIPAVSSFPFFFLSFFLNFFSVMRVDGVEGRGGSGLDGMGWKGRDRPCLELLSTFPPAPPAHASRHVASRRVGLEQFPARVRGGGVPCARRTECGLACPRVAWARSSSDR